MNYPILSNLKFIFKDNFAFFIEGKLNGSVIVKSGNCVYKFNLANIHFHIPAEHLINNVQNIMEFHLVHSRDLSFTTNDLKNEEEIQEEHKGSDYVVSNGEGPLNKSNLVIGIMFTFGRELKLIEEIAKMDFKNNGAPFELDLNQWVNKNAKFYYYYDGSLTTQNCDQQVNWFISKEKQTLHE